jgi:hypothetical protein
MPDERSHEFTHGLFGSITHTDLSSTDPEAIRDWCAEDGVYVAMVRAPGGVLIGLSGPTD